MRWERPIVYAVLLLAWAALAFWQWQEYGHERKLAQERLQRQADAVLNAVIGGIRSHRRLGFCFEDQLQGALDFTAEAEDVRAVVVAFEHGGVVLSAGATDLFALPTPLVPGELWSPSGYQLAKEFRLSPQSGGSHGGGPGFGAGRGGGFGSGQGRGQGRGATGHADEDLRGNDSPQAERSSPFQTGGKFIAVLLLDRSVFDSQCRHAAWARISVVAAGALVLFCVTLVWRATVRLAEAQGRTRLLETEARHLRELSQAAAGLAHETRNPLGLIRGWTQRLTQSDLDPLEQKQQAQAIVEECDRVTARINQFLAFARPSDPILQQVNISEVARELAALLEPDFEAKGLSFEQGAVPPAKTIRADREMFRQALFNMVQNAVQFSPEGEEVEIAVRGDHDGQVRIEVADRGAGVKPEVVESLFLPYFTTRPDGTGLGLAIVRHIATAHGWRVGYEPRHGGGSIFWLNGLKTL